jgi:hypothetical protein
VCSLQNFPGLGKCFYYFIITKNIRSKYQTIFLTSQSIFVIWSQLSGTKLLLVYPGSFPLWSCVFQPNFLNWVCLDKDINDISSSYQMTSLLILVLRFTVNQWVWSPRLSSDTRNFRYHACGSFYKWSEFHYSVTLRLQAYLHYRILVLIKDRNYRICLLNQSVNNVNLFSTHNVTPRTQPKKESFLFDLCIRVY